jgi:hypothetical protein
MPIFLIAILWSCLSLLLSVRKDYHCTTVDEQMPKERLIYPQEIEKVLAARRGHQRLILAGRAPVAALR